MSSVSLFLFSGADGKFSERELDTVQYFRVLLMHFACVRHGLVRWGGVLWMYARAPVFVV